MEEHVSMCEREKEGGDLAEAVLSFWCGRMKMVMST